ncbi:tRNA preQ1(34) S-adenosylmethionine ribosyltransferase-isomerase QueA [bacterium]|nr:MAG: tRNA preQ1(34) S-adenosylmethionine ribosyltransferase-isomerase QueA [bacterium]
MQSFQKLLESYDYKFPPELIAQAPVSPRDAAKLLVYDRTTGQTSHDIYRNILKHLPKNSVLVLNQTKVVPARLEVIKPSGGKARILYISSEKEYLIFLSDRKLEPGSLVKMSSVTPKGKAIAFTVFKKSDQFYYLKPSFPVKKVYEVLNEYGQTPLPPYIKSPRLKGKKLLKEYNTVFAKTLGSVAAPTASLHFTPALLNKIQKAGIQIVYTTLHVNLGTFAPLHEDQWKKQRLHEEWYEISNAAAKTLNSAKKSGSTIIAVGTTVVRTLESASNPAGKLTKLSGNTHLFITERTKLRFVDSLLTNFHVPRSSLLMLVSSLIGRKRLLELYKMAIRKKYRLFSFGDGMYIK